MTVTVENDTAKNKYVIKVTPLEKALGKTPQTVMIYPKDMFGAMVK